MALVALCLLAPAHGSAAVIIAETFNGPYSVTDRRWTTPSGTVTGFDSSRWIGAWQVVPTINSRFPPPAGSAKSIMFTNDKGHIDVVGLGPLNLREFYYRLYMRFGDADSYSDHSNNGERDIDWAKLFRIYSTTWQWNIIMDELGSLAGSVIVSEIGLPFSKRTGALWRPCKWFYLELHVRLNTPGQSDGLVELRSRNVSDDGTLVSFSWPEVNIVRSSTEPVGTVRVGGNAGGAAPAAIDGFVRYTNIEFATGGWIGEVGPPPTAPRAPTGLQIR